MDIEDYFKHEFSSDLRKLEFKKPNAVILNNATGFGIDKNTIYFGGSDWTNLETDIELIEKSKLEFFLFCLFAITIIDLTMYTYYKQFYENFRVKTMYPKFGWSGFGPHYENPKKLIMIPEQKGLIKFRKEDNSLDIFINLFIKDCDRFFQENSIQIETKEFIKHLVNDNDLSINEMDESPILYSILSKLRDRVSQKD